MKKPKVAIIPAAAHVRHALISELQNLETELGRE
jgi:hypothetical protein